MSLLSDFCEQIFSLIFSFSPLLLTYRIAAAAMGVAEDD
jgi:hypothetical protein